jgi:poly(A) polymerase
VPALAVMTETGLLETVLGGVPLLASLSNTVKLETALGLAADSVRRLGALGVFVAEDAERLRDRLRLANTEADRLLTMANGWWRIAPTAGELSAKALLYRLGPANFLDRVLIAWSRAREGIADGDWRALATLTARWTAPVFPLKAADFIARGVAKGPALGMVLHAAEEAWIASGFPAGASALQMVVDAAIATQRGQ